MFSTAVNSVNGSQGAAAQEDSTSTNKWRAAPPKPTPTPAPKKMYGFGRGAVSYGSK